MAFERILDMLNGLDISVDVSFKAIFEKNYRLLSFTNLSKHANTCLYETCKNAVFLARGLLRLARNQYPVILMQSSKSILAIQSKMNAC